MGPRAPRPLSPVLFVGTLTTVVMLGGIGSGCGPAFRHVLSGPAKPAGAPAASSDKEKTGAAEADVVSALYDDPARMFRVAVRPIPPHYTFAVEIENRSELAFSVNWRHARFVDVEGTKRQLIVWPCTDPRRLTDVRAREPRRPLDLAGLPVSMLVPAKQAKAVYMHSRDAYILGGNGRLYRMPQLPDADLTGREVELDVVLESASFEPRYVQMRFQLASAATP
jgi:hypothetical protein